jgi:hypothetical protein
MADKNQFLERPATYGLPLLENGFRSTTEETFATFANSQLLDLDICYPETDLRRDGSDVSLTWYGHRTYWERDFDLCVKNAYHCQVQCKGTDFTFYRLRQSLKGPWHVRKSKQFDAFRSGKNFLVNGALRQIVNELACEYVDPAVENVRPLFFTSAASVYDWTKQNLILKDELSFLRLLEKESNRFKNHFAKFVRAVFPTEYKILNRAVEIFRNRFYPQDTEYDWRSGSIAGMFGECLERAKAELNCDDSERALFRQWQKTDWNKLKLKLPRRFRPTKLTK